MSTALVRIGDGSKDLFTINAVSSGIRFRDLLISYSMVTSAPSTAGAAIRVTGSKNVTCERVYFKDCLQALYLDDEANACGLIDCYIDYDNIEDQVKVSPITLHDLRDTHASLLAKKGGPLEVVSKRLGHADIRITAERYLHVYQERDAQAASTLNSLV